MPLTEHLQRLITRISSDRGVTSVEYAIMASLIAVVIVGSVTLLGTNLNALYDNAANALP